MTKSRKSSLGSSRPPGSRGCSQAESARAERARRRTNLRAHLPSYYRPVPLSPSGAFPCRICSNTSPSSTLCNTCSPQPPHDTSPSFVTTDPTSGHQNLIWMGRVWNDDVKGPSPPPCDPWRPYPCVCAPWLSQIGEWTLSQSGYNRLRIPNWPSEVLEETFERTRVSQRFWYNYQFPMTTVSQVPARSPSWDFARLPSLAPDSPPPPLGS